MTLYQDDKGHYRSHQPELARLARARLAQALSIKNIFNGPHSIEVTADGRLIVELTSHEANHLADLLEATK